MQFFINKEKIPPESLYYKAFQKRAQTQRSFVHK